MYVLKPSHLIIPQEEGIEGVYKQIELAGRTCTKTEPKYRYYTEDKSDFADENTDKWKKDKKKYPLRGENISAKKITEGFVKMGHGAMLEHGTVYLKSEYDVSANGSWYHSIGHKYSKDKYSVVNCDENADFRGIYVTTNYRVLVENGWLDDLKYMCEPTEYHEKRVTVRFVMDRVGTQSVVRHRHDSFGQESTRYCNYSNEKKFNKGIGISQPVWVTDEEIERIENNENKQAVFASIMSEFIYGVDSGVNDPVTYWYLSNLFSDFTYNKLTSLSWTAEQSRGILPLDLKSEIVVTGYISDWEHFFDLRLFGTTGKPHPDIKAITKNLYEDFVERGYVKRREYK